MSRVVVVGAGVVGLTVAVELARSGHRVDVVARDLPRETASAVGPGLWRDQSGAGDPRRRTWAQQTREALAAQAGDADDPDAVVRLLPGVDGTGRAAVVPVVDLPRHLDRLVAELEQHGGSLTRLQLTALPTGVDAVVECTGLGARHFGADAGVTPVREQLAVVETTSPLGRWWSSGGDGAAGGTAYVVPAGRRVLVGAAVEPGEWERTVRPDLTAGLVERASAAVPELAGARVVGARVGLWPSRPRVRLERVGDVVHCAGLGAAGLTLATGCAHDVALLLA